jgi:prohibitin 1
MTWLLVCFAVLVFSATVGVSVASKSSNSKGGPNTTLGWGVGIVLAVLLIAVVTIGFGIRIIDPGEAGVRVAFGKFAGDPLPNGMHIVPPWVNVIRYETRMQECTMVSTVGEGDVHGNDSMKIMSKDNMPMTVDLTVFYKVMPAKLNSLHEDYGLKYKMQFVRPTVRAGVRDVFGLFDGKPAASTERHEVASQIKETLISKLRAMDLEIMDINIRDVMPPPDVLASISQKVAAEEDAKRAEFEADREVTLAEGQAKANEIVANSITSNILVDKQIKAWQELASSQNAKIIIPAGSDTNILLSP